MRKRFGRHSRVREPLKSNYHGEMVETIWAEMNQVAPAARQMNSGHRIGYITAHYSYWNWLKITKIHEALMRDYAHAREQFQQTCAEFLSRAIHHYNKRDHWESIARQSAVYPNGIVKGIYQHHEQGSTTLSFCAGDY